MKAEPIATLMNTFHKWSIVLWLITCLYLNACSTAPINASNYNKLSGQSISSLRSNITRKHPSAYMLLASKLYAKDQKDKAVVFYYVGQIRFRALLAVNPDIDGSEKNLYISLKEAFGKPINEYAGENLDEWLTLIDQALEWHEANPNRVTPKTEHIETYNNIITEFKKLKTYIVLNKESIRAQRTANGLINR